ncbi:SPI-7-type island replicative DNA helicase [Dickeya poaceiphila]|uniref:Replicative DNA helicase n=1 Tax=Dickeya poaceiphila TaxID=568768 RepID=A0A5B8IA08_9GAMM|nr:SPI-7-type island replicative DNA helicase [Dickeya poaceiphila]QDX30993.1 replicative DNA helicase [Dickeya poaceiphila]
MAKSTTSRGDIEMSQLPQATDAEQAVLGGLMIDNHHWDSVIERVSASDFYHPAHQRVFTEMQRLIEMNRPIDLITLTDYLESHGSTAIDSVGGFAYLAEMAKNTPSAANIDAYADIVRNRSVARQLVMLGRSLSADAMSPRSDISELAEGAEKALFEIAERQNPSREMSLHDGMDRVLAILDRNNQSLDGVTGTPTGFAELDAATCGLQPTDLIILAGRPSMGKTAFGMDISARALERVPDKPVFIFSLEMATEQLLMRMMSSLARVEFQRLRSGKMDDEDWAKISGAMAQITEWGDRLVIDDNSDLTPSLLRARCRRYIRKYGKPSLILLDYLQLMKSPGHENRTQEIADISRSLKAIAKQFRVPLVALSQLNRLLQQRSDKRPTLSDLRDGGSIEQDADLIMFVHREEVYEPDTQNKGLAEIIIGKQRNGPLATVTLEFNARYASFVERLQQGGR